MRGRGRVFSQCSSCVSKGGGGLDTKALRAVHTPRAEATGQESVVKGQEKAGV